MAKGQRLRKQLARERLEEVLRQADDAAAARSADRRAPNGPQMQNVSVWPQMYGPQMSPMFWSPSIQSHVFAHLPASSVTSLPSPFPQTLRDPPRAASGTEAAHHGCDMDSDLHQEAAVLQADGHLGFVDGEEDAANQEQQKPIVFEEEAQPEQEQASPEDDLGVAEDDGKQGGEDAGADVAQQNVFGKREEIEDKIPATSNGYGVGEQEVETEKPPADENEREVPRTEEKEGPDAGVVEEGAEEEEGVSEEGEHPAEDVVARGVENDGNYDQPADDAETVEGPPGTGEPETTQDADAAVDQGLGQEDAEEQQDPGAVNGEVIPGEARQSEERSKVEPDIMTRGCFSVATMALWGKKMRRFSSGEICIDNQVYEVCKLVCKLVARKRRPRKRRTLAKAAAGAKNATKNTKNAKNGKSAKKTKNALADYPLHENNGMMRAELSVKEARSWKQAK